MAVLTSLTSEAGIVQFVVGLGWCLLLEAGRRARSRASLPTALPRGQQLTRSVMCVHSLTHPPPRSVPGQNEPQVVPTEMGMMINGLPSALYPIHASTPAPQPAALGPQPPAAPAVEQPAPPAPAPAPQPPAAPAGQQTLPPAPAPPAPAVPAGDLAPVQVVEGHNSQRLALVAVTLTCIAVFTLLRARAMRG